VVYLSAFLTLQAPLSISCLEERREKGGKGEETIEERIEDRIEKRGEEGREECYLNTSAWRCSCTCCRVLVAGREHTRDRDYDK
jgi:hypothetical protein